MVSLFTLASFPRRRKGNKQTDEMEGPARHSPKMKPGLSPISKAKPAPSSQPAQRPPLVKKEAPADLPVLEAKSKIVKMVLANSVVVLVGETGSGKTTQIPQFLLDEVLPKMSSVKGSKGGVAVTQPRRVAAISVASYVSELRGCRIGEEVGYVVRFDDKTSSRTKLKYMTDGILLKELLANPALPQYSVIMLDEAHERTLHGDVLFGLLKRLHQMRPHDLKIIIMSATLNTSKFSAFWNNAPIGYVTGRAFPVTVFHTTEPQADYLDAAVNTIMQIHTEEAPGDILCFLTGQDEIEDCRELLTTRRALLPSTDKGIWIVPLYAAMAPEQQQQAFERAKNGERKIILATNIAETSITIEGIVYVIDCGLLKAKQFNPNTGMELLLEVPVSKAQARQRTGRAGRLQAGRCYRLYMEPTFESLEENPIPEILRCSLDSVVLQMKAMNIDNLLEFEFMDKPSPGAVLKAMNQLYFLGALDGDLKITPLGRILAEFPVDPMAAKTLVRAVELDVADDVCAIIAMLSTENVRLHNAGKQNGDRGNARSGGYSSPLGDHITALKLFQGYMTQLAKAGSHHQMREWCEENRINERQIRRVKDAFAQLKSLLKEETTGRSSQPEGDSATSSRKRQRENGEKDPNVYFASEDGNLNDFANVRRAFCAGYFLHAAFFHAKRLGYITCVSQLPVEVHPSSGFSAMKGKKPYIILYNSVIRTTKQYMRDIVVVREDWLQEEAPLVFKRSTN